MNNPYPKTIPRNFFSDETIPNPLWQAFEQGYVSGGKTGYEYGYDEGYQQGREDVANRSHEA